MPNFDPPLTVLGHLASRNSDRRFLREALRGRLPRLAASAVEVAKQTGEPMGSALADALRAEPNAALVLQIASSIPGSTVALRDAGLVVADQVIEAMHAGRASVRGNELVQAMAWWAGVRAGRLQSLHRPQAALDDCKEAVSRYRQLGAALRDDLALALTNLAILLYFLDEHDEAVAAVTEAIEIFDAMGDARVDQIARSVGVQRNVLQALGRFDEALSAAEEAVRIYRALARILRNDRLRADRAAAFSAYSKLLSWFKRHEEALSAIEETVALSNDLQEASRDAFLPSYAAALLDHSTLLAELGRHAEAHDEAQKAVGIYRSLAGPLYEHSASLPDLAMVLNNLANRLSYLDRHEDALAVSQEAVQHYETLSQRYPEVFAKELAVAHNTLARRLRAVDQPAKAFAEASRALILLLPRFQRRPPAYADWMKRMREDYVEMALAAGTQPASDLLASIDMVFERLPLPP